MTGSAPSVGNLWVRQHIRLPVLASVLALLAAGCGGGDKGDQADTVTSTGANLTAERLPRFALEPSDLPAGYKLREPSKLGTAAECSQAETREGAALAAQLQSLGIQACYAANYQKEVRKGGRTASNKPGSGATLFRDAASASRALPILRQDLASNLRPTGDAGSVRTEDIPVTGLGDEALPGLRSIVTSPAGDFRLVFYIWRTRNVVAFVGGSDTLGDFTEQSILDLAKKLDFRAIQGT
ncbi:MAG: hypothetical protein M3396_01335 [Actinomycetota bacterium]|nr:hypothetical protein [Actinomycetota bacterium]